VAPGGENVTTSNSHTVNNLDGDVTGRDFGFYQEPTAVTLAAFSAVPQGSTIVLTWETATELDNLGFNIYRAEAADGPRAQLNASLIPSQTPGTPTGATYQLVDETSQAGTTYYWLEALDVFGAAEIHGPVSAGIAPYRRLLIVRPRPIPSLPILRSR
jgi:hypothetical protein